jgi:hypothetical protein
MTKRPRTLRLAATALLAVALAGLSGSARGQSGPNAAIVWNAIASTAIMTTAG